MFLPRIGPAVLLLAGLIAIPQLGDAADPPKNDKLPILTDAGGKEVVLKKWKISFGTAKAVWVPNQPEVFKVREVNSTALVDGIVTFIPLSRLSGIKYDYEQLTADVSVAGLEQPVRGNIRYVNFSTITLEAEVDQGASGVAALRYRGGIIKGGFKEIKFPSAKAPDAPPAKGELFSFLVVPEGKGKTSTVGTANNVKALYRFGDGSEKLLSWLMFKKTLKMELSDIQKMHVGETNVKEKTSECEVQKKDGTSLSVTLLSSVMVDGKPATLVGLLGDVDAGWKLFPVHSFTEFQPGEMKIEEKKDPLPKKVEPKKVEPKKK